jgi:ribosomal protein S27AE
MMRRDDLAGWRVEGAVLQADETIAGYAARDVDVRGTCYLRNCKRSYWFDWTEWLALGMAQVPLRRIQEMLRCHRLTGCNLHFQEQGGRELTLGLLNRDGVLIRIACGKCGSFRLVRPASLIRRLKADQRGGDATLLAEVAVASNKPCGKCRATTWTADAILTTGSRLPAWLHQELERRQRRREDITMKPGPPVS